MFSQLKCAVLSLITQNTTGRFALTTEKWIEKGAGI